MEKDWKEKERKRNGKEGKGRVSKLKGRLAPGAEGMDAAGPTLIYVKKTVQFIYSIRVTLWL